MALTSTSINNTPTTNNNKQDTRMGSTEIIRGIFGPSLTPVLSSHACSHSRHSGRLYLTSNALCFYSNLFGFEKKICLELSNVVGLTLVRSTSIQITYVGGAISSRSTANNYGKLGVPSSNANNMLEEEDSAENNEAAAQQQQVEYIFRSFDNREAVLDILKQLHTATLHHHGNGHETPVPIVSQTATAARMTRSIRSNNKPFPSRSVRKSKSFSNNNQRSQSVPPKEPRERDSELTLAPTNNRSRGFSSPDWKQDGIFQQSQISSTSTVVSSSSLPLGHHGASGAEQQHLGESCREFGVAPALRERLHSADTAASSTSTSSLMTAGRIVPEVYVPSISSNNSASNVMMSYYPAMEEDCWNAVKQEFSTSYKYLAISTKTFPLLSLDTFYQTFLSNKAPHSISKFQQQYMGDTQVTCTHWKAKQQDQQQKGGGGGSNTPTCPGTTEQRNLNSLHPRSAKLGPSSVPTFKTQTCTKYGSCGIRIKTDTTVEKVPYCDCFVVQDEWLLENTTSTSSAIDGEVDNEGIGMQLTVRFRVNFVKSTMFKKVISNQTKEEVCNWYTSYLEMVQSIIRSDEQQEHEEGNHGETSIPAQPLVPEQKADFQAHHLKWNPQFILEHVHTAYSSVITLIDGWYRSLIRHGFESIDKGTFRLSHVLIMILIWKLLEVNLRLYKLENEVADIQREQLKLLGEILKTMSSINQK